MQLMDLLKDRTSGPPPIWMMRQAGRHLPEYRKIRAKAGSFLDLCYNPELACEVTLQPVVRYDLDAAIIFSDILVIPDALGQKLRFIEGEGPRLDPIKNRNSIENLNQERVLTCLQPVFDAISLTRTQLSCDKALIGFCGAPWTVATYMIAGSSHDQEAARLWAYRDPETFSMLIDMLTDISIAYLNKQIEAGADVLQIFDSWAGVLPEEEFARWCLDPLARIVSGVKSVHPHVPIIAFPRGIGLSCIKVMEHCAIDAISIDTTVPLAFARQYLQPHIVVQGNLDPLALLAGGDALNRAIEFILNELGTGAHIFNLSHGVLPQTPTENVIQMVRTVRRWSS